MYKVILACLGEVGSKIGCFLNLAEVLLRKDLKKGILDWRKSHKSVSPAQMIVNALLC